MWQIILLSFETNAAVADCLVATIRAPRQQFLDHEGSPNLWVGVTLSVCLCLTELKIWDYELAAS